MELTTKLLATIAVATVGGWLGNRTKAPAGAMMGALFATAVFSILTGWAFVPSYSRVVLQIVGGVMLGWSIDRAEVVKLRKLIGPVILMIIGMLAINLLLAVMLVRITSMNLPTAFLAGAPGGMTDMALMAGDFGADPAVISILQLFRMLGVYVIYPPLLNAMARRRRPEDIFAPPQAETESSKTGWLDVVLTMAAGAAVSALFILLKLPAGALIGGVVGSSAFNIATGRGAFPKELRYWVLVAVGAMVGAQMTMETVRALIELAVPIVVIAATLLAFTGLMTVLMWRVFRMEPTTALMATTPGGIQELSIMAADIGCNVTQVVTLHTVRLLAVVCLFPFFLKLLMMLV